MEKGRRPTVLNTCLKRSLFVLHLSVKRGPRFSVPANRASTIIAWMEKRRPSLFFFFFWKTLNLPSQKRWQEFLQNRKNAMYLSFNPTYIYIHNVVLTVSEEDPGKWSGWPKEFVFREVVTASFASSKWNLAVPDVRMLINSLSTTPSVHCIVSLGSWLNIHTWRLIAVLHRVPYSQVSVVQNRKQFYSTERKWLHWELEARHQSWETSHLWGHVTTAVQRRYQLSFDISSPLASAYCRNCTWSIAISQN